MRSEGFSERAIFVIDRSGVICFSKVYDQDEQPDNQELWDVLANINPDALPAVLAEEQEEVEALPRGGIVMYCTPWCPDCRRARNWLEERGLEYIEVNTNENRAAAAQSRVWGKGFKISPTFDIDGEIILDFDTAKLLKVLTEKNYL